MHADNAIEVRNLSKEYQIADKYSKNFAERLADAGKLFSKNGAGTKAIKAIDNISFEVPKGSVLGIVGDNGSGKSTLLKIISEITAPSEGEVLVRGKISSILEVGTGFHPELSGRRNIYLSGSILGLTEKEIDERYDRIVGFSGLEKFMHVPVKKYSSGMFMRLAFSLAANLTADIILLDEVLSVGDADFRIKCLEKIKELAHSNKTIVIVSHDLQSIVNICTHFIVMEKGNIVQQGTSADIISDYMEETVARNVVGDSDDNDSKEDNEPAKKLSSNIRYSGANIPESPDLKVHYLAAKAKNKATNEDILTTDEIVIECELEKLTDKAFGVNFIIGFQFLYPASAINSRFDHTLDQQVSGKGRFLVSCTIPPRFINNGIFSVGLFILDHDLNEMIALNEQISFRVKIDESEGVRSGYDGSYYGPFMPALNWTSKKLD